MNTERIWNINSYIQQKGQVHLNDLMALYPEVSAMTIRRDIDYLERQGHIVRTRGGAKSIHHLTHVKEDAYSQRAMENRDAKLTVAKKAEEFISNAGAVFFDAGTTMMCLAGSPKVEGLFCITSGPNIALELSRGGSARTVLLGGTLNSDNLAISGASALEQVKTINIDTAFIATSGFSVGTGFTNGNFDESELKRIVISRASRVVMLIDSTKIGKNLPYTFARLSDIDVLVCDGDFPQEMRRAAEEAGVSVI